MKGTLCLVIFFIPVFSIGQTLPIDLWHEGKVVFESGDTVLGLIKYDVQDMVQITREKRSEVFPAEKILYFEIFDQAAKTQRQFYPLPYLKNYKKPIFFELLSKGKLTLLSREQGAAITYSQSYNSVPPKIHRIMVYQYYVLNGANTIKKIPNKPARIFELMGDKADAVHEFTNVNQLDCHRKYDLKRIIDYYNSLFN